MGEEPPKQLWTPDKKVPDAVRKMAWLIFMEQWKARFTNQQVRDEWDTAAVYRRCLEHAQVIYDIDLEKNPLLTEKKS